MTEFDAHIKFHATNTASPVIETATQKILKDYRALRQEQRATRGEFELNHRVLADAGRALRSVGSIANSLTNIYTKYNVMQLRISDSNRRLKEAQEDYNRTLSETGPGSEQSIRAARDLTDAKEDATRAQQEQTLGMIGFGFELASTISLIITAIPKFKELAQSLNLIKTATAETAAISGASSVATAATSATAAGATAAAGAAGAAAPAAIGPKLPGAPSTGTQIGGGAAGAAIGALVFPTLDQFLKDNFAGYKTFAEARDKTSQEMMERFQNLFSGKGFNTNVENTQKSEKLIIQIENKGDAALMVKSKPSNVEVLVSEQ